MTTYSMAAIATLNAKLGQRCGEVWRGGGVFGAVRGNVTHSGGEG